MSDLVTDTGTDLPSVDEPHGHGDHADHVNYEAADAHPALGASYPKIHDEAGDTPMWVPVLGVAILILLFVAGFLTMRETPSDSPTTVGNQTEIRVEQ